MNDYIIGTTACAITEATGNAAPVVDAGANYTIPKFTPFALTASATDANGDVPNLTYTWEQFDNGGDALPESAVWRPAGRPVNDYAPDFPGLFADQQSDSHFSES